MGKVFVHKPLKRAEQRALEHGPEVTEAPPTFTHACKTPKEEDTVEIIIDGKSFTIKRKEFDSVMRRIQRDKDRELYHRFIKLRDTTLDSITIELFEMKTLAEILKGSDPEKIIKDIKLETVFDYLGEMIQGWSPVCLHCQATFTKKSKTIKHMIAFRIDTPEDVGLVNPLGEGAKEIWLAAGLCRSCDNKKPEVHKRRFINLLMISDESLRIRFYGNLESIHGRLTLGGPRRIKALDDE